MKRILAFLMILTAFTSEAQTPQTSYVVPSVASMKLYSGNANRIYVSATNEDYAICSGCTANDTSIYAGAGGRKWKKIAGGTTDVTGKVDKSTTITINGDTKDLSLNRSWTIAGGSVDTSSLRSDINKNTAAIALKASQAGVIDTAAAIRSALTLSAPKSTTISINGVSQDLSTNRSWTVAGGSVDTSYLRSDINKNTAAIALKASQAGVIDTAAAIRSALALSAPKSTTISINGVSQDLSTNRSWTVAGGSVDTSYLRADINKNAAAIALKASQAGLIDTATDLRLVLTLKASKAGVIDTAAAIRSALTLSAPKSTTISINGVSQDLSTNRSWTVAGGSVDTSYLRSDINKNTAAIALKASQAALSDTAVAIRAAIGTGTASDFLSPLTMPQVSVTGATVATIGRLNVCSGTTANYTVTLPPAAGNAGKMIGFRMAPGLTKLVTLDGDGTETIDEAFTRIMWANEVAILMCDGTTWTKVMGKSIPMVCRISLSTPGPNAQEVPATTFTRVMFTLTEDDNTNMMASTGTYRINILRQGAYDVVGNVSWDGSGGWSSDRVFCRIGLNGNENNGTLGGAETNKPAGTYTIQTAVATKTLAVNDYITVAVYSAAGGAKLYGDAQCYLVVKEVITW